jgi:hypothetical protein
MFFLATDLNDATPVPVKDCKEWVFGVALAQYSMGVGIEKFQQKGEAGMTKEVTQKHDMNVFCPIKRDSLTKEKRAKALELLMFLKEKRDNTVKGRMCADGQKQRGNWSKQELTSPTVAMKSVFIIAIVDAHKGRDVASFDIPGAFLHMDSDKDITMILRGRLAKLMGQVAPTESDGDPLCQDAEGYVWALKECPLVLQEACS